MAPNRSCLSTGRQSNVHFTLPKMADPFIVPNPASSPHDRLTNASSIFRPPQAMLSELVQHERAKSRSSKRSSTRDVLGPKHAGVSKIGRRTPLSTRSDRNTKVLPKGLGSGHKRSGKRHSRRIITTRPDHPLFRQYEGISSIIDSKLIMLTLQLQLPTTKSKSLQICPPNSTKPNNRSAITSPTYSKRQNISPARSKHRHKHSSCHWVRRC